MADFIKSKIFLSVLFIGLAAFVFGGATIAWFTDGAEIQAAEFKAGTVEIQAGNDGEPEIKTPKEEKKPECVKLKRTAPGDCATVTWEFENVGTKAVQLKVKLSELWSKEGLGTDNVYYCPVDMKEGKGWVMADDENNEIWLYYIDRSSGQLGSIPGTYNPEDPDDPLPPAKVELKLVVVFDAEETDNDYQDATYSIGGEDSKVYAIQASNKAPETQWTEWEDVIEEGYLPEEGSASREHFNYFHNGEPGSLTECWIRANGGEYAPEEPEGSIVTFSKKHLEAASPGNKEGDPHADTQLRGKITKAKDKGGKAFTGWVDVTFKVYDKFEKTESKTVIKSLFFQKGEANLDDIDPPIIVKGIYTRDNKNVSVTINGVTK